MQTPSLLYEEILERYAALYKLIGIIELELKKRVPATLSNQPNRVWYGKLLFDPYWKKVIEVGLEHNKGKIAGVEHYLPLSLWARLFFTNNYESLWKDHLYKTMPNLEKRDRSAGLHENSYLMRKLIRIRNRVAHYEITKINRHQKDLKVLKSIIKALGI